LEELKDTTEVLGRSKSNKIPYNKRIWITTKRRKNQSEVGHAGDEKKKKKSSVFCGGDYFEFEKRAASNNK
jgi:hypothetical protein